MTHDNILKKRKSAKQFVDIRLVNRIWERMTEVVEEDERIREKAAEAGKTRVRYPASHWSRIIEEVGSAARGSVNFYPSKESITDCRGTVVFDAVSWHKGAVVQKPLRLAEAMELLVKHTQGWCWGKTSKAIIYTDDWDRAINQWKMNLDVVRNSGCQVSVVLVTGEPSRRSLTVLNF